MASDSPPCHLHAIKTVWATVEPFLDLQSTIRASQTCRALHEEIVDADTQKIKVSRFGWCVFAPDGPWKRIPYYPPSALNAIHFPSLRAIDLGFTSIKVPGEGVDDIEDAAASCFPILVSQLAYARNLEVMSLDMCAVLREDNNWRFEPIIHLFGRNLARCKKLRELRIFGSVPCSYCTYLMRETLMALTPVLRKQKNVMRRFGMDFKGGPVTNASTPEALHDAAVDFYSTAVGFYEAVLACSGLEFLTIDIPYSVALTDSLLEATRQKCLSNDYSPIDHCLNLRYLHIGIDLGMFNELRLERNQADYQQSARILFEHFFRSEKLRNIDLSLPEDIWGAQLEAVTKMLSNKPQLLSWNLNFCGYSDDDDKAIDLLEMCGKNGSDDLQIHELRKVDGVRLFQLMQCAETCHDLDGFACLDSDEEAGEDETGEVERREVGLGALEEDMPERVDIDYMWLSMVH